MQTKKIILDIKKELKELDMLLDGMAQYPTIPAPLVTLTETKLVEVMERLAMLKMPADIISEAASTKIVETPVAQSETVPSPQEITPEVEKMEEATLVTTPNTPTPKAMPEPEAVPVEAQPVTVTTTETTAIEKEVVAESTQQQQQQPETATVEVSDAVEEPLHEPVTETAKNEVAEVETVPTLKSTENTDTTEHTVAVEPEIKVMAPPIEKPFVAENETTIKSPVLEAKPVDETSLINETIEQITEPVLEENEMGQTNAVVSSQNKTAINKTLAESLQGGQSRNDALTAQGFPSLSSQMSLSPINDIKKAINLNDRFRFQKELFNNDNNLYNNTVDAINALRTIEEAQSYITTRFAWDFDQDIAQEFIQLVQRRFI